jgi:hypothetical protein
MRSIQAMTLLIGCQLAVPSSSGADATPPRSFLLFDTDCKVLGTNLADAGDPPSPGVHDGERFTRQCSLSKNQVTCLTAGQDGSARFGDKATQKTSLRVALNVASEGFTASSSQNPTQSDMLVVLWQLKRFVWMTTSVLASETGAMLTIQKQCSGRIVVPES